MLCPEVWTFDSPAFHAQESLNQDWNEATKLKLFNNIDRRHQNNQFVSIQRADDEEICSKNKSEFSSHLKVTVIIPNYEEEDKDLPTLIEEKGSSYIVKDLDLHRLIDPVFLGLFVKKGKDQIRKRD